MRGACVHNASAAAVLAHVKGHIVDADLLDVHLPEAHLLLRHGHPTQRGQQPLRVVAAQRDLPARPLPVVGASEEDAELRRRSEPRAGEAAEVAELRRHREGVQGHAEDAVEVEGLEGLGRHLHGHDDADLDAGLRLPEGTSDANLIAGELPSDFAGAVADGGLVAEIIRLDHGAVDVDGRRRRRLRQVVLPVREAALRVADRRRDDDVPRARVEDDAEVLRGSAERDLPRVGGLEGEGLAVPDDGHRLPAEGHLDGPAALRLLRRRRCRRLHYGGDSALKEHSLVVHHIVARRRQGLDEDVESDGCRKDDTEDRALHGWLRDFGSDIGLVNDEISS
mmetsp:Transcript_29998/g.85582  ORF Transcript_29998/g.85582 Transcript_29998/m.85582 type:complete len:337 (+) Transcript_29998:1252-2262(+)